MLGVFEKARAVLDLYTTAHPEWGVTEVARQLGFPPSSAHVLMTSLTQMGLLHRTVAGRYRLGFKLLALSQVLLSNTPWRDVARDEMTTLGQGCGEALLLAAFDGGQLVTVATIEGRHPDSPPLPQVGAVLPPYPSASAALLLAHRPWSVVRRALQGDGAERTPAELDAALLDLERVVQDGLASSLDAQMWSVAAPVRNHNGEVIAALSVHVPATRTVERRMALQRALEDASQRLSARIGHVDRAPEERLFWTSVQGQERLQRPSRRTLR
ncbi:IclR family transcriptional regulator [Deinococcus sonorensis]|uniref:IclR family transcriptional regulator n=2 Tax=Deinococcus sonorensis TaxID=309891 RepID=A0AAU7U638_9DEIO